MAISGIKLAPGWLLCLQAAMFVIFSGGRRIGVLFYLSGFFVLVEADFWWQLSRYLRLV